MYVELKNINKSFESYQASKDVCFGVEKGKLSALLGPSGSGKTTILRMIAGLENPDSGEILIDGKVVNDIPASRRNIGFVFQNYALFRYMTVYDNIAFGLRVQKKDKRYCVERVRELIELTGLKGLEKRYPSQLSGGQRQRVAFARSLAPTPGLLLLDEPFAAIDAKVRKELRTWLRQMINIVGVTGIFVTHDQDEAVEVADEIIITNQGRVEQVGSPAQIYKNPESSFVARFIGESALIENYDALIGFDRVPNVETAIVRPEFVEAFKSDNEKYRDVMDVTEQGVIKEISFRGGHLEVKLDVGNGIILTTNRSLERRPISIGESMRVLVYRLYLFDGAKSYLLPNKALDGRTIE
ncbi:MAG: ABC transporter ATP-binding protein [Clostridia bacterium]|nr:ABC transporter ATP-binding protein [Clostridia bacterium]